MGPGARRNLHLVRKQYDRATRVPEDLTVAMAKLASTGREVWSKARGKNRFADFAPVLEQWITLKREEASALSKPGTPYYDTLLDDFEPGMTTAVLAPLFEGLREPLADLRARVDASSHRPPDLSGPFSGADQLAFSARLAPVFGYRTSAGRIDLAVHPFCMGNGGDVRITTRVDETDPLGCLYSTIHEIGHAIYEQNIDPDLRLTPVGAEASMGVHESQSRMMENQIARSRPFADWLLPAMREQFGDFGITTPDELYAVVNRVHTGFIRTEADEVHYNLHVILRFGLERDMIEGELAAADLEEAWNTRFEQDFGIAVPDASRGVLQDIHWSEGLFGYFPTYTLGNIYAAELFAKLRADIDDIDGLISRGTLAPITHWLTAHIHQYGNTRTPTELITHAVGHAPTSKPLIDYLETKYTTLYHL